MEEHIIPPATRKESPTLTMITPNPTRPVWTNPQMSCEQCQYNDQDVDTYPCAKCHTRD